MPESFPKPQPEQPPESDVSSEAMTTEVLPYPTETLRNGMEPSQEIAGPKTEESVNPPTTREGEVPVSGVREISRPTGEEASSRNWAPAPSAAEISGRGSSPIASTGRWEGDTFVGRGTIPVKPEAEQPKRETPGEKAA